MIRVLNYTKPVPVPGSRADKRARKWADIQAKRARVRINRARGEQRCWGKVTQRSKNGAAMYSTMQLIPGVSTGRNTGGKRGNKQ